MNNKIINSVLKFALIMIAGCAMLFLTSSYVTQVALDNTDNIYKIGIEAKYNASINSIYELALKLHENKLNKNEITSDITQIYFTDNSVFFRANFNEINFPLGYIEFNEKTGVIINNLNYNINWSLEPTESEYEIYGRLINYTVSNRFDKLYKTSEPSESFDFDKYDKFYNENISNIKISDDEYDTFSKSGYENFLRNSIIRKAKAKEELKEIVSKYNNWLNQGKETKS